MTAADRPSVTDNARAALARIREFLTYGAQINPREDVGWVRRRGYRDACRDALNCLDDLPDREWPEEGPEWAAGRAETTTATDEVHLTNPDDGASFCDQPATIITEAGDTRPVCQTCHRRAMKHSHARAEMTDDRDAAQVITDYLATYTLPANYTYPDNPHETNGSVAKRCGPLIARELDRRGLLATARTRPTREQIANAIGNARWGDEWLGVPDAPLLRQADAVLALLTDQPTEAEAGARALEQAADEIDWEWETYTAPDGIKSIRPHGAAPSTLLRERAARLRGGDRDE